MTDLLPATSALLVELLDGLDAADVNLPEVRVGLAGRSGVRYWLEGQQRTSFAERRPAAQFDELRSGGYLRKLRKDGAGVHYAFTPAAFELRDGQRPRSVPAVAPARIRPAAPPSEITGAVSWNDLLRQLASSAERELIQLAQVSGITTFRNDPNSGVVFIPMRPHSWTPLDPAHIPRLGSARDATQAWLSAARLALALGEAQVAVTIAQQVVAELDAKKVDAKKVDGNPKVAPKAESLIRRFREYGRRATRSLA